jgi:hypothetical protein
MSLRFNWAISLPPDRANLFFLRASAKNVPKLNSQASRTTWRAPQLEAAKGYVEGDDGFVRIEGKELDGSPIFAGILSKQ